MSRIILFILFFVSQTLNLFSQTRKQDREPMLYSKPQIINVSGGGNVNNLNAINNPIFNIDKSKKLNYFDNSLIVNIYEGINTDSILLKRRIDEIKETFNISQNYFKILVLYDGMFDKDNSKLISTHLEKFGLENQIKLLPIIIEKKYLNTAGGRNYYYSLRKEVNADALLTFSYDNVSEDSSIYHLFSISPDYDYSLINTKDIYEKKEPEIKYYWIDTIGMISKLSLLHCKPLEEFYNEILYFEVLKENSIDSSISKLNKYKGVQHFKLSNYLETKRLLFLREWIRSMDLCDGNSLLKREKLIENQKKFLTRIDNEFNNDSFIDIIKLYALLMLHNGDSSDFYKDRIEKEVTQLLKFESSNSFGMNKTQLFELRKVMYQLLVRGITMKKAPYTYLSLLDKFNFIFDSFSFKRAEIPDFIINNGLKFSPKDLHDANMGTYYAISFDYHYFETKNYDSMSKYFNLIMTLPDRICKYDTLQTRFPIYSFYWHTFNVGRLVDFGLHSFRLGKDTTAINLISFYLNNNILDSYNVNYYSKSDIEKLNNYGKILYKLKYKHNYIGDCISILNLIYNQSTDRILEKKMIQDWIEIFRNSSEKLQINPKEYMLLSNMYNKLEDSIKTTR